jgi:hypothetical protein
VTSESSSTPVPKIPRNIEPNCHILCRTYIGLVFEATPLTTRRGVVRRKSEPVLARLGLTTLRELQEPNFIVQTATELQTRPLWPSRRRFSKSAILRRPRGVYIRRYSGRSIYLLRDILDMQCRSKIERPELEIDAAK